MKVIQFITMYRLRFGIAICLMAFCSCLLENVELDPLHPQKEQIPSRKEKFSGKDEQPSREEKLSRKDEQPLKEEFLRDEWPSREEFLREKDSLRDDGRPHSKCKIAKLGTIKFESVSHNKILISGVVSSFVPAVSVSVSVSVRNRPWKVFPPRFILGKNRSFALFFHRKKPRHGHKPSFKIAFKMFQKGRCLQLSFDTRSRMSRNPPLHVSPRLPLCTGQMQTLLFRTRGKASAGDLAVFSTSDSAKIVKVTYSKNRLGSQIELSYSCQKKSRFAFLYGGKRFEAGIVHSYRH